MALLEREAQLAALDQALVDSDGGRGRVVLVTGEAGLGKSSLLRAWLTTYAARTVLSGACDPTATPRPLGPLGDLVGGLGWDDVPEVRRAQLFRRVLLAIPVGAILVLDDLHWADDATLDLVGYLGRRLRDVPALLVLAYREEEAGSRTLVRTKVGDLATAPGVVRVPVPALTVNAVARLAESPDVDATALHRLTAGNPFYVTEVLASPDAALPETVRDAVLARAARLSGSARALLDACAVIGSRTEPRLLADVVAAEADAVEECLTAGIVLADGDVFTFRHELARQAVLGAISPTRRQTLHGYVLAALVRSPRDADPARLTEHATGADDAEAVLSYAPVAGAQASRAQAHRQAHAHYARAVEYAAGVPPDVRADLLEALADECVALDRIDEGLAALDEALAVRREYGDAEQVFDDVLAKVPLLFYGGRTAEAELASLESIRLAEALPPGRRQGRAYRQQAHLRMLARDVDEAVAWGERAVTHAAAYDDHVTASGAHNAIGSALVTRDPEAGVAHLEQARAIAREHGYDQLEGHALLNLGSAFGEVWQPHRAAPYLDEIIGNVRADDLPSTTSYAAAWRAITHLQTGAWAEASRMADSLLRRDDLASISRVMALLALGRLRARRGDPGVSAALDEALAVAEGTTSLQRIAPVRAARLEAALLDGDPDPEVAPARAAYDAAVAKHLPAFVGELGLWLHRAGEPVDLPGWADPGFALLVAADWRGSAAVWEARGCVYERALALAEGDDEARIEALGVFTRLEARPLRDAVRRDLAARGVRGVPRGPRALARVDPWGLTAREQQVVALVAAGLSNDQVAERLVLSRRTVEHHVSAALAKLGSATRGEAGSLWRAKMGDLTDVAEAGAS